MKGYTLGLFPFVVERFVDTRENEFEFFVTLRSIAAYVEGQEANGEQRSSLPEASTFKPSTIEESMLQNLRVDGLTCQVRTLEQRVREPRARAAETQEFAVVEDDQIAEGLAAGGLFSTAPACPLTPTTSPDIQSLPSSGLSQETTALG